MTVKKKAYIYYVGSITTLEKIEIPLGADKMGHCKSEAYLIETCCKRHFFQHYDFNT